MFRKVRTSGTSNRAMLPSRTFSIRARILAPVWPSARAGRPCAGCRATSSARLPPPAGARGTQVKATPAASTIQSTTVSHDARHHSPRPADAADPERAARGGTIARAIDQRRRIAPVTSAGSAERPQRGHEVPPHQAGRERRPVASARRAPVRPARRPGRGASASRPNAMSGVGAGHEAEGREPVGLGRAGRAAARPSASTTAHAPPFPCARARPRRACRRCRSAGGTRDRSAVNDESEAKIAGSPACRNDRSSP